MKDNGERAHLGPAVAARDFGLVRLERTHPALKDLVQRSADAEGGIIEAQLYVSREPP
jgi:hypothetical protein